MNTYLAVSVLLAVTVNQNADDPIIPVKTKESVEGVTAFESRWYSKSLRRADENCLSALAKYEDTEIYRLTVLPTWGNPIIVRVQKKEDVYLLTATRLSGQGGYDPGKLAERKEIQLSSADSKAFASLMSDLKFFDMPTDEKFGGFDGDESVFEGVSSGRYHVITRWCATAYDPKKRGLLAFNALCKFLIDKSNLSQRPQNKSHKLM